MRNILILSPDSISLFDIERSAEEHGFRVKLCTEVDPATYWLSSRLFDLALIHDSFTLEQIQSLSSSLWAKNRSAKLCVLQSERNRTEQYERQIQLLGGRVISLSNRAAWEELFSTLKPVRKTDEQLRILVVEDLLSPRDIICVFIESLGFRDVHGVGSAMEALKLLEENPDRFNCVITDIRMPEVTGKQLIEVIRKTKELKDLPVVVLTAYGTADILVECLGVGASGFLVKPPKKVDLLRELSRAIRINNGEEAARMVEAEEVEKLHDILEQRGIV